MRGVDRMGVFRWLDQHVACPLRWLPDPAAPGGDPRVADPLGG